MSVCVYWAQIIIKKINVVYRAFLWHGTYDDSTAGAVEWDRLCQPKSRGGLGFRNLKMWNNAAVGKHLGLGYCSKTR